MERWKVEILVTHAVLTESAQLKIELAAACAIAHSQPARRRNPTKQMSPVVYWLSALSIQSNRQDEAEKLKSGTLNR
jgi:hypothetical protein